MHWEKPGPKNTQGTIELALKRARELGIKYVVVASSTGRTALQVAEAAGDLNICCITYHVGFDGPGKDRMPAETKEALMGKGVKLLTTTHLLAGVDRAIRNKFGGIYPSEIMAHTLRMLGQGIKVCIEISGMALDGGLIPYGEEIVAIAGSGKGADSAVIILPAHSNHFFNTKVKEIICKPREI